MVVYRDREDLLGALLANDILIENGVDFLGYRQVVLLVLATALLDFFPDDVVAQVYTLVTDEHRRARNQLADLVLALATKAAIKQLAAVLTGGCGFVTNSVALRKAMVRSKSMALR